MFQSSKSVNMINNQKVSHICKVNMLIKSDEDQLKHCIAEVGPVSISAVVSDFSFGLYRNNSKQKFFLWESKI